MALVLTEDPESNPDQRRTNTPRSTGNGGTREAKTTKARENYNAGTDTRRTRSGGDVACGAQGGSRIDVAKRRRRAATRGAVRAMAKRGSGGGGGAGMSGDRVIIDANNIKVTEDHA
ncbi:hypothetical protein EVAR_61691_1 [Eumeta japonica]|uniref:Uncharacterized protein n=1 Tax=Eumeta variegata TaxID=151549 RepID=A0A4C1ZQU1_EUMVA|nr:hypothetical protein EVAR_61691_1 [Eumeta japonica]